MLFPPNTDSLMFINWNKKKKRIYFLFQDFCMMNKVTVVRTHF